MQCRDGGQRSMTAMLASLWRSPAAGVRWFNRSSCPTLSSMLSAAVFSSTRATRLVPGIGAISSPCPNEPPQADLCSGPPDLPATPPHDSDDADIVPEVLAVEKRF